MPYIEQEQSRATKHEPAVFKEPSSPIPDHDDLTFRLKKHWNRGPSKILPPRSSNVTFQGDAAALYIGSGPSIDSVLHMLPLVNAPSYILSDLTFEQDSTRAFKDCRVATTSANGYSLVKENKDIRFIMVDQAAFCGMAASYQHVADGTFIYVHTFNPAHPWLDPLLHSRIGISRQSGRMLYKVSSVDRETVEESLDRCALIRRVPSLGDVRGGVNKNLELSKYSTLLDGSVAESYDGEGFVREAQELVDALSRHSLNSLERHVLRENLVATTKELDKHQCKAHEGVKRAYSTLL